MVSVGLTRQSSLIYASEPTDLKYLSALPVAIALVLGYPSRNSARSDPLSAPENVHVPRGFCCDRTLTAFRLRSPPSVRLWRPRLQNPSRPPPYVWLWVTFGSASVSAVMLENASAGGPQFSGSWLLPVTPARLETLVRPAKYGVTWFESCVNWARGRSDSARVTTRVQVTDVSMPERTLASVNPNTEV